MVERLCVIPGDGVGQEVIPAAVTVLEQVLPSVELVWATAGWQVFQKSGQALPAETLAAAHDCGAVLFGAVASPSERVEGYRSPIVALRRELNTFANLRPVRSWPGGNGDRRLDLMIVRENTEGLYAGRERREGDMAIAERVITRQRSQQVARAAFELAQRSKRRLTLIHKANVLRVGDGLWREACLDVAQEFPDVPVDEALVDAAAYHMVRDPGGYDLLLCPNLYGDILSDLAAGLGGGLGMVPSLSIGERRAIAEPVHGTAPDIAGQGIANPIGAMLSVAMLAHQYWGKPEAADAIEAAIERTIADGILTRDIAQADGEWVTTEVLTREIIRRL